MPDVAPSEHDSSAKAKKVAKLFQVDCYAATQYCEGTSWLRQSLRCMLGVTHAQMNVYFARLRLCCSLSRCA
eukprot:2992431-Amphidinium_carterae.1